ncbi:MAG: nitric oxide-sensing protein NosP [Aliiglaciecola sp.]|uniref:nitric oxide-sensing protein NosP n=1 Tax=Aliiglaciecola sp. TaxID=1872441 RepID=UPI0032998230
MGNQNLHLSVVEKSTPGVAMAGSEHTDPVLAAEEIYAAIAPCQPTCVVFYCGVNYPQAELSKELTKYFSDTVVIGCTSAGEITPLGYRKHSISAFALSSSEFAVESILIEDLATFNVDESDVLVGGMMDKLREKAVSPHPIEKQCFALSLLDGLSVREELVINALSLSLQDIPIVGGSAGDDQNFLNTQVYYDGQFYTNAAVIMLVNTICEFEVFSQHHLSPEDEKLVVTQVAPNSRVVHEFNAEPAALEYCRINGLKLEDLNSKTFAMYPLAVQFGEQLYIRSIQKVNDDLSLTFFCAIDSGVVLTKMISPGLLPHTSLIFNLLKESVGEMQLVIGFDCIHRRIEIEHHDIAEEMSVMYRKNNVIGFSTYGEQINGLHLNHTFTGVAIGYPYDPNQRSLTRK